MAKAGDGKPRSDSRRAAHRLMKRVTAAQLEAFEARATDAGFSNAQGYLTAFVLGDIQLDAAVRRDAIRALGTLGRIGNHIDRIADGIEAGRVTALSDRHVQVLEEARTTIENLGREIREALR